MFFLREEKYVVIKCIPYVGQLVYIVDYDKTIYPFIVTGFNKKRPRKSKELKIKLYSGSYYCWAFLDQIYVSSKTDAMSGETNIF